MDTDNTDIHVGDPVYQEEIRITRGERCIYLIKYGNDSTYVVHDEDGEPTDYTWTGDVEGVSAFIALHDIFTSLYPGGGA